MFLDEYYCCTIVDVAFCCGGCHGWDHFSVAQMCIMQESVTCRIQCQPAVQAVSLKHQEIICVQATSIGALKRDEPGLAG